MKSLISIVVPAYNEQVRLADSIKKILDYVTEEKLSTELIIVDDGSDDNTAEIGRTAVAEFPEIQTRIIRYNQNRGKGFAVKTGLSEATGDIALFSDTDLSAPISEMPKLIDPIKNDEFDVTFGSRALNRDLIGIHQPWRREQSGKVFNLMVRKLTGMPFWDTQCGFKAFNMRKFRPLLPLMRIERFGFDVEFLYVAFRNGLRLKEIPVRWDDSQGSKLSMRSGLYAFNEVNRVRQNARRGFYDLE